MRRGHHRLLVPEVVQTSAMDCGPASLKCLLEGFGISVSYGRLREACQTDVDGTSIDTMEEIAVQLGLEAEQIMVPPDYVLLEESDALPAIAVVVLTTGIAHFVVAWRRHGRIVQVMDPGVGRRWPTREQFVSTLHLHTQLAPVSVWREWATSEKFLRPLRRKLTLLGHAQGEANRLVERSAASAGWRPLAALEAAVRTVEAIVNSRSLRRGREATRVVERLYQGAVALTDSQPPVIPSHFWSVRQGPADVDADADEQIYFRGAVLVHANRRRAQNGHPENRVPIEPREAPAAPLSPELLAALEERQPRPGIALLHLLAADGALAPVCIVIGLLLATSGVIVEAVLFRALLDLAHETGLPFQRMAVMGALLLFTGILLLLDFPVARGLLSMGRRLEARLRMAFLKKIPRLGDRYFHSRLNSDMASRSHQIHRIRILPYLGGRLLRLTFELLLTAAGIIWLDPGTAPLVVTAALLAAALPLAVQPILAERDMRLQNHAGALSRHYLDAFLGLVPLQTHRAERALRREHETLLNEWTRASFSLKRLIVWAEGMQFFTGFGLAAWLLVDHVARTGELGSVLLLVYWALNLPVLGRDIAQMAWQYPELRNRTLRLLEPLGAPEEITSERPQVGPVRIGEETVGKGAPAAAIAFDHVSVRVSGRTILENLDFAIEPGSHVAIVGPTGAGKSSLAGILLGWHRPAAGRVLVDGVPLEGACLERLRAQTAWIDPAVQIWNRTLLDNLSYGSAPGSLPLPELLEEAELRELLQKLPDGLQTSLGESGALVSGGEGQRVRLGRAMHRTGVRLAILDEPFRGLDRQQRRALLARARGHWREATLLCITHDVGETLSFPRVLVVEAGQVVEDGDPHILAQRLDSRYRSFLLAEADVREGLWSNTLWQHLRLENGQLRPEAHKVRV
jgi:ATP-binding cassette subfamily B protein